MDNNGIMNSFPTHSFPSPLASFRPFLTPAEFSFSLLSVWCGTALRNNRLRASASESTSSTSTITIDNSDSGDSTAFVIRARKRIGLLQVITRVFKVLSLSIDRATVKFEDDFFIKTFFVTDSYGNKIEDSENLERIKQALAEAIDCANELYALFSSLKIRFGSQTDFNPDLESVHR